MSIYKALRFLIASFISSYFFNTYTKTYSSWLRYESIKALEIKTSMVFNLSSPNNTIIDYTFFISAALSQFFILTAELAITIGIPTKETKRKIETHSVIAENKISNCQM